MGFPDRIERTVEIAHPPARVWAALTTAEGLAAWPIPDPAGASMQLAGGLPLEVVTTVGDWAQVRASNGWIAVWCVASATVIVTDSYEPTSLAAGVPMIRPLLASKVAQGGRLFAEKVSASPSTSSLSG